MISGLDNPVHIVILLTVVLLLFGAKRLPEMGRSLGSGIREFKEAMVGNRAAELPAPGDQSPATPQAQRGDSRRQHSRSPCDGEQSARSFNTGISGGA